MRNACVLAMLVALAGGASCAQAAESNYTRHDWDKCKQIAAEDDSVTRRCAGLGGVPLLYTAASDASSVGFGEKGMIGDSDFGDFYFPKETVEWRSKGGKPYAAILRYDLGPAIGGPFKSWLAVYKLQGVKSSCVVALVDGAHANANERARDIADQDAARFTCDRDKMRRQ